MSLSAVPYGVIPHLAKTQFAPPHGRGDQNGAPHALFRDDPLARIAETEEELREKLDAYAGWPENIQAMVTATQLDDVIESTVSELPVSWKWGEGNVTLLGDAAHAQLPALGLGVSTAMGDIEELVKQVRSHGLSSKALRWYEWNRMPACAALQLMSRGMYLLSKLSAK